ncbi:MAG: KamA family radical SAM protein, partial [Candidatus Omnitrophica bacterium]|nr:KamA family radical SAM protein [Candidatus Omnitrophota bacterium]
KLSSPALSIFEDEWQASCAGSIKNIDELAEFVPLNPKQKLILKRVTNKYHMRIPHYFFSLIEDPLNPNDPVRMQCVPDVKEIRENFHETIDPLGEEESSKTPFLVHRYPNRVLLIVTGRCFMYCRHCTRKRLWAENSQDPSIADIEKSIDYVRNTPEIREIIVSGGDPLTLPSDKLDYILSMASGIEHVEVVRIGTRAPVVLPERVDEELCRVLEKYEKLWVNVQFNHPNEITSQSAEACRKIQKCGIPISNQSVLLKGVNDDPDIMRELCEKLTAIRVRPYYLYECDPVVGAYHFRTSIFKGVEILEKMRGHTSGMCIPTFVIDGPDGRGKIPVGPNYLLSMSDEEVTLRNYKFETFPYHNPKE